ncbi:hypothetical protein D3C71_1501770 [compost metagenome]
MNLKCVVSAEHIRLVTQPHKVAEHGNAAATAIDLHPVHSPSLKHGHLILAVIDQQDALPVFGKPQDRMTLHHPNSQDCSKPVQRDLPIVLHQLHIYVWADVAVRFEAISCFSSRVVGQPQL